MGPHYHSKQFQFDVASPLGFNALIDPMALEIAPNSFQVPLLNGIKIPIDVGRGVA